MINVSTVIPVYNRPELVVATIKSALGQQSDGHEIVVIDNCSTDSTWNVVQRLAQEDSRIRCIRNERNVGPVRNWKIGVQAARGEFCHILFSDDLVHPDFIKETVKRMDSETGFTMVGHAIRNNTRVVAQSSFQEQESITREELLESAVFWNPKQIQLVSPVNSLFRRTDLVNSIIGDIPNPLGIDFAAHGAGPDQLIFMIIAQKYPRVACVNRILVNFIAHEGSISVQARVLDTPRETARAYFVKNYWPQAEKRYRAILWLRSRKNPALKPLFYDMSNESTTSFDYLSAIRHAIKVKVFSRSVRSDRID